jgi:quercetin dioxygenase-like cupin family protein/uncharacterized protein YgiM (DUF1202 family)
MLLAPGTYAQDATPPATPEASPVASPVADQTPSAITDLFSYELAEFPVSPVSIRLLRITLQPGASSPMHTHPGPEFDLIESGTLTVDSEGDADLTRAGEELVSGPLVGEELAAGDLVVFPPGIGMNLTNASDEEVVILSAVFHPVSEDVQSTRYTEGDPAANAFDGVSYEVLGDGIVQSFPDGPATIELQDVVVPAGADLPGTEGTSLYSLVDGDFAFSVDSGDVQVSRTNSPGLRPNAAPQQEFTLAVGDAAFFPEGIAAAPRADQDSELSVLRLTAIPSQTFATGPASLTFMTPVEAPPEEEVITEIGIGAVVVTTTDSLNLRAEPSTSADPVDQLDAGVELTIVDGPQEADEFTWWQVEVNDSDGPVTGWVAEEFISLPDASAEVTETPTDAAATPESGTPEAATDEEFAEGDVVVINDDNVRIRSEATTDSEPVDAFPLGTELTVTGAPEEANDIVWYPVTLVENDSISGWVAADLIDLAPGDEEE